MQHSKLHVIMELNVESLTGSMWIKMGDNWQPYRASPDFEHDPEAVRILQQMDPQVCADACMKLVDTLRRAGVDADFIDVADD